MNKKSIVVSVLLIIVILSFTVAPFFADEVSFSEMKQEGKISNDLKDVIKKVVSDELIPVCIWYQDIDQNVVDNLAKQRAEKEDDLFDIKVSSNDYLKVNDINNRSDYMSSKSNTSVETYKMAHRHISSEKYQEKSSFIINLFNIEESNVEFRSSFAPIIVANLSATEIITLSKSSIIESIYYYTEDSYEELQELNRDIQTYSDSSLAHYSLGLDKVFERFDLDGEGIKIGMAEGTVPGSAHDNNEQPDENLTYSNYHFHTDNILNITYDSANEVSNIQTIVEDSMNELTSPELIKIINIVDNDDANYLLPSASHSHANVTPKVIIGENYGIAPKATIYATLVGRGFANTEALLNCGIDVYMSNISLNFLTNNLSADYITLKNKYLDFLALHHHLIIVMPGGNFYDKYENGETKPTGQWINALALGYNVITVGGYNYVEDSGSYNYIRKTYRWQNCDFESLYGCEKPDLLGPAFYAGGGTSVATPSIVGVIALMLQLEPELKLKPREVKAILLASCHKKAEPSDDNEPVETMTSGISGREKNDSSSGITERQGAGIPDAWKVMMVICQHTYGSGNVSTSNTIHIIQPPYGSNYLNFSLCWFKYYSAPSDTPEEIGITEQYLDDLSLAVYHQDTRVGFSDLNYSSTEMCYVPIDNSNDFSYWINIDNNDHRENQFAYAWSSDNMNETKATDDGVYFIRTAFGNKSLGNDVEENQTHLQAKKLNTYSSNNSLSQMQWVIRRYTSNYASIQTGYGYLPNYLTISSIPSGNYLYSDVSASESVLQIGVNESEGSQSIYLSDKSKILRNKNNNSYIYWQSYQNGQNINQYSKWYFDKANYQKYDANADGIIDYADVLFVMMCVNHASTPNNIQAFLADADGDRIIDVVDATIIYRFLFDEELA